MQFGVSEALSHWGLYRSSSLAIVNDGRRITYAQLDRQVTLFAQRLTAAFPAARRIGLAVSHKSKFTIALLAIIRCGKSVALFNQLLPTAELYECIKDAGVEIIVFDKTFLAKDKRRRGLLKKKRTLDFDLIRKGHVNRHNMSPKFPSPSPTDEWGVLYSSGTTGIPKGIVRDHYSIVSELLGWCLELELNQDTCFYIGRPLFYTGGLLLSLSTLLVGGTIAIDTSNEWADYQRHLGQRRVDIAFFVPGVLRDFVRRARRSKKKPRHSKRILVMGAHITGKEKLQAAKVLGSIVIESWGNSEGLGTITTRDDLRTKPNSIGRPFLSDPLYIVDEQGRKLPPGKVGRIAGAAEAGFREYCNKPEVTNAVIRDEMIVSDDLGHTDREGYFYVDGRVEDDLYISGQRVFINKIESLLRLHPLVRECAVVPRETGGTPLRLLGAIVCSAKADDAAIGKIIEYVNRHLARHETLHRLYSVPALPRNAAGKVMKDTLQAMLPA